MHKHAKACRGLGLKRLQGRAIHEPAECLGREDLPARGQEHLPHVFAADAKTAAGDAGDYFILGLAAGRARHTELPQVPDSFSASQSASKGYFI
jgi:hypothetical protein